MLTALSVGTGGLGRFGNTCFTIAGTIGIAIRNGHPYCFPRWQIQDNALFGQPVDDMAEWFENPLPEFVPLNYTDAGYHWEYRNYILPEGSYNIQSHLQDPRYFEHCIEVIRATFRMKNEPKQSDVVAVHYRAGDYIDDPDAYHPRQPLSYYKDAMSLFPVGTEFWVFSDDIKRALEMFEPLCEQYHISVINQPHYMEDFKLMKRCKSFITANSSFSLMAAILGEHPDKVIVCPRRWFGPHAGLTFEGYPKDAIII